MQGGALVTNPTESAVAGSVIPPPCLMNEPKKIISLLCQIHLPLDGVFA